MSVKIEKKANVILADPNWAYQNFTDKAHGAAISHYQTAGLAALEELKGTVQDLADDNCVLGLWGCWPKADENHRLYSSWGFDYVTGFPWVKVLPEQGTIRRGIGFWTQGASEFLSICRQGSPRRGKLPGKQVMGLLVGEDRQFYDRIQAHSVKPYGVHEWLEELFPDAMRIELFATQARPGWLCLGHKTGYHLAPTGVYLLSEAREAGLVPKDYDPDSWTPGSRPPVIRPV